MEFNQKNIIDEIKKGNSCAFQELYSQYYTALCRFALKYMEDPEEVEDIVQEMMAKIWEQRTSLQISNLKSYLFTSIKNSCLNKLDHLQVIQKHIDATSIELKFLELEYDTEFILEEEKEMENQVIRAINELPQQRKKIICLKYLEGKGSKEIAELTQLSIRTVETHIYKGLKTLSEKFNNELTILILFISLFL